MQCQKKANSDIWIKCIHRIKFALESHLPGGHLTCNIGKDTLAIVLIAPRPSIQNLEANKCQQVIITGPF